MHDDPPQANAVKTGGEEDIAAKSARKRQRRAHKQLNRAMAMMEEAKREIAALIEGAQSTCQRLLNDSTDDDYVGWWG